MRREFGNNFGSGANETQSVAKPQKKTIAMANRMMAPIVPGDE
jgi:hypothetical protein